MTARWLLLAVPVAFALAWREAPPLAVFAAALVAIVPLVGLMGDATERLAARLGPTVGGLFNSTLNNLPELIIGGVALSNGLAPVVKASLTGAILANLLLALGIALIAGGLTPGEQKFDPRRLAVNASMLLICAFCFIVPAMFNIGTPDGTRDLSFEMSFVLIGMYVMNVATTLFGGGGGTNLPQDQPLDVLDDAEPVWRTALVLVAAAGCLGVVTEILSHALEPAAKQLGLSKTFSGLVLLGGAGSLGEVLSGYHFARRGKPSLVLAASVGSTIQLVLLVAPLLVFGGRLMGQPMDLAFTGFEVVAIVLATVIARDLIQEGKSNWFEGFLLLGVYAILAIGFYHLPE